jgi:hypothetical protein
MTVTESVDVRVVSDQCISVSECQGGESWVDLTSSAHEFDGGLRRTCTRQVPLNY